MARTVLLTADGYHAYYLTNVRRCPDGSVRSGWVENGHWWLEIKGGEWLAKGDRDGAAVNRWPPPAAVHEVEVPPDLLNRRGGGRVFADDYNGVIEWARQQLAARLAEAAAVASVEEPAALRTAKLQIEVEFDPRITDPDGLADALNKALETALSTDGLLDEVGNPGVGVFEAVPEEAEDGQHLLKVSKGEFAVIMAALREYERHGAPRTEHFDGIDEFADGVTPEWVDEFAMRLNVGVDQAGGEDEQSGEGPAPGM